MKKTIGLIGFLGCLLLLTLFAHVTFCEEIEFFNKPLEKQSSRERAYNRAYLHEQTKEMNEEDRMTFLINLLTDPETCHLPREELIAKGQSVIPTVRDIAVDTTAHLTIRAEALAILSSLKDPIVAGALDRDPIISKYWIFAHNMYDADNIYIMYENYRRLQLVNKSRSEQVEFLIGEIKKADEKAQKHGLILRNLLMELAPDCVVPLCEIFSDATNKQYSRLESIIILSELKNDTCIEAALNAVKDATETELIHARAIHYLEVVGDKSAIPILEEFAKNWKPKEGGLYRLDRYAKEAIAKILEREK